MPPRRGDALLFFSLSPQLAPDLDAVHGGCPPRNGEKWIAQQFFNLDEARGGGAGQREGVPAARGGEPMARRQAARALTHVRALFSDET